MSESVESLEAKAFECELEVLRHAAQGRNVLSNCDEHQFEEVNTYIMEWLRYADTDVEKTVNRQRTRLRHLEEAYARYLLLKREVPMSDSLDAVEALKATRWALSAARKATEAPAQA